MEEETVDVTLTLEGVNDQGFQARHVNHYKGVSKAAFAQIQKRGAEMLVALSTDLAGPAPTTAK